MLHEPAGPLSEPRLEEQLYIWHQAGVSATVEEGGLHGAALQLFGRQAHGSEAQTTENGSSWLGSAC